MKYRFVEDLTSDVLFEAYGQTLEEVMVNSAEAMFSVVCKVDKVKPKIEMGVEVEAESEEKLLYNWLSELLTQSEIKDLFLSKFEIEKIDKGEIFKLKGKAYGETADPSKGETVVKAVTYYSFGLERDKKGYKARVSLDI